MNYGNPIIRLFRAASRAAICSLNFILHTQKQVSRLLTAFKITPFKSSRYSSFAADERGNVALLFGLMSILLFMAMGGGIDFSRAYLARQKLSHVATLACQYASRPAIVDTATASYNGSNGTATYVSNVNNFISTSWLTQKVSLTQTNGSPFNYTQGGAANVSLTSAMPTTFIGMFGISSIALSAQSHCYDTIASVTQRVPDSSGQYVIKEGFEANGTPGGYTFYNPNGQVGTQPTPTTYSPAVGYTGANGNQWHITGYCFEQDSVGVIKGTVPEGNFSGELDCDDGTGRKGNSAISTLAYLAAGTYELRYFFTSRVTYPNYDPPYLCGSKATDLSWANDTNSSGSPVANALRSNQINVYLDLNPANNQTPLHTTLDGQVQLGGSNLIDMCVHSSGWIERSVDVNVTTPGYYWLSFAADGENDSYGGQIDNIRLCRVTCPGTVQDNFPTAWSSNTVLFTETFQSPTYTQDPYISESRTKSGNLAVTYGTSGTSSSGWPTQSASGWAVAPYNEVVMWLTSTGMTGPSPGSQFISLQGWNGYSNSSDPLNRSISRQFLLDPGYYKVSYNYVSLTDFSFDFIYGTNCTAAPTFTNNATAYGKKNGHKYGDLATVYNQYQSTNILNVYMANSQLISTPSVNTTLGGAPTYTNPNGTTGATPTTPIDGGTNFSAYNASAVNPVIDTCSYSGGFTWTPRSVNVKISKPGWYWLNFSAQGDPITALGGGPGIDNVKLTALGSLYSSAPSSPVVTIPVADPQPGSSLYYTGFSIVADPLTP